MGSSGPRSPGEAQGFPSPSQGSWASRLICLHRPPPTPGTAPHLSPQEQRVRQGPTPSWCPRIPPYSLPTPSPCPEPSLEPPDQGSCPFSSPTLWGVGWTPSPSSSPVPQPGALRTGQHSQRQSSRTGDRSPQAESWRESKFTKNLGRAGRGRLWPSLATSFLGPAPPLSTCLDPHSSHSGPGSWPLPGPSLSQPP